jgi:hypothetical protein
LSISKKSKYATGFRFFSNPAGSFRRQHHLTVCLRLGSQFRWATNSKPREILSRDRFNHVNASSGFRARRTFSNISHPPSVCVPPPSPSPMYAGRRTRSQGGTHLLERVLNNHAGLDYRCRTVANGSARIIMHTSGISLSTSGSSGRRWILPSRLRSTVFALILGRRYLCFPTAVPVRR